MNLFRDIKSLVQYKFVTDSTWTFVSYIVLAVSGIIANIIIGNNYGPDGLGIFNQAVALYMIFSMVSVFGLNTSVVKYIAQHNQENKTIKEIFTTSTILTLGFSLILVMVLLFFSYLFPSIYFNSDVTKATSIIILSLPFFSLNKIFMALINALRHMKAYAIIQSLRWILIIGFIIFSVIFKKSIYFIFYSFLYSELILFTFFLFYYSKYFSIKCIRSEWYKTHLIFGSKSALLGFLSETNNKIDVFLISFFLSNYYVGIYSFAAEIAKGFLIIGSVVQLNVNPLVSDLWERRDINALQKYTWRISRMMLLIMGAVLLIAVIIYPFFVKILMNDISYIKSIPVFCILLPGILLLGIYSFAGGYLSMANLLDVALKMLLIIIIFNVLSCVIFIHFMGFYGAAISTSSTFILTALLIHYFIKTKMGISLISFKSAY